MVLALFGGEFMKFRTGVTSYREDEDGNWATPPNYEENLAKIDEKI